MDHKIKSLCDRLFMLTLRTVEKWAGHLIFVFHRASSLPEHVNLLSAVSSAALIYLYVASYCLPTHFTTRADF